MKPQKLYPAFKDYIWGGNKLKEKYGKDTQLTPCAESWELSFHKDGESCLEDRRTLREALGKNELGKNSEKFDDFPVLIKFIDAQKDLSVQVHPTDDYAASHEGGYGKTEMWYVVDADEGAGIYLGFKESISEEELKDAIDNETLCEKLSFVNVKKGDCYFIPSGTIHAIGAGCLICEIQQNSNLTYRVFDYGRRDKDGNLRPLHVKQALEVAKREPYTSPDFGEYLGVSDYFKVKKLSVSAPTFLATDGSSFHCLCCVDGSGELDGMSLSTGDSFFVPADYGSYTLNGNMTLLQTEI